VIIVLLVDVEVYSWMAMLWWCRWLGH